jgi:hypothetical protein
MSATCKKWLNCSRNGWLGATFFDALDLVTGHAGPQGDFGNAHVEGDPPVVDRLPEGQRLPDCNPLRILMLGFEPHPPGVGAGHHACLS